MPGARVADAKETALAQTRDHVAPHRVAIWDAFGTQLVMGRREGYRMWDLSGHELMDFHMNLPAPKDGVSGVALTLPPACARIASSRSSS